MKHQLTDDEMLTVLADRRYADLLMAYRELREDHKRLAAIVDRLPKTVNGVPVTPGMELWGFVNDDPCRFHADGYMLARRNTSSRDDQSVTRCWSTEAAAIAAKGRQ